MAPQLVRTAIGVGAEQRAGRAALPVMRVPVVPPVRDRSPGGAYGTAAEGHRSVLRRFHQGFGLRGAGTGQVGTSPLVPTGAR